MHFRLFAFLAQFLWLTSVLNGKAFQGVPGYGRNLLIKTLPAVDNYQSNVYEVFMEPYLYELNQQPYPASTTRSQKQINLPGPVVVPGIQAVVYLIDEDGSGVEGELVFTQVAPNGPVSVEGNVTGLTPGLHGVHIHQRGTAQKGCKELGPHFIAYYGRHGGPRDAVRHVGDLGNIKAEEGEVPLSVRIVDHVISLTGPRSVVGRSLVITKGEDDYGRSSTEDSALTGASGPPVACGVITFLN